MTADQKAKIDWLVAVLLEAGRTRAGGWATKEGMISFRELAYRTLATQQKSVGVKP